MRSFKYFDIIMTTFVAVLITSNITSSAKIIDLRINFMNIPLAFDAGTLLFPVSYVFGDILTEVYGFKRSRRVIWTGFFLLLITAFVIWAVGVLPGESTWQLYAGDKAYNAILGGMSSGGIVTASLIGYWFGEFINSFILAKMKVLTNGRWLWTRTISSTLLGEAFDSIIFISIASIFGVFPWSLFSTLVITNYLFKVFIEIILTPFTYLLIAKLKQAENEDYYDRDTNFNPFSNN